MRSVATRHRGRCRRIEDERSCGASSGRHWIGDGLPERTTSPHDAERQHEEQHEQQQCRRHSQAIGEGREAATAMLPVSWPKAMLRSTPKTAPFAMLGQPRHGIELPLLLLLIAITCLSQFYRVSNA